MPDRDDRLYLRDMVEFCERVEAYSAGHDQESLLADRMRCDAVLRNLWSCSERPPHACP